MTWEELSEKMESILASRKAVDGLYATLGKQYYEGADQEELDATVNSIRALEEEAQAIVKELAELTQPAAVEAPAPVEEEFVPVFDVEEETEEEEEILDPVVEVSDFEDDSDLAVEEVPAALACGICGATLAEGDRFCLECGSRVGESAPVEAVVEPEPEVVEEPAPAALTCANCGAALNEGDRFCLE